MTYAQELNRRLTLNFYKDYDKTAEAYREVEEYENNLMDCKVNVISPEFRASIKYYLDKYKNDKSIIFTTCRNIGYCG